MNLTENQNPQKPISCFYSTSFRYRRITGQLSSVEVNQTIRKGKERSKRFTCNKNLLSRKVGYHGFTLVILPKVCCLHLLFMDDFSEAAEKSLNCKLEKKHVPVSKSIVCYTAVFSVVKQPNILKPSSKCFLVHTQIQK